MRTFISIEIPRNIKDNLIEIQNNLKKLEISASYPFKKNIHITLLFLGEKSEEQIKEIREKLSKIKSSKFQLDLKGLGAFPNLNRINVVWIGSHSNNLGELNNLICRTIDEKNDKMFTGHLTIARVKSNKNIDNLRNFIKKNQGISIGSFEVNNFILKKSTLTSTGPIYQDLETYKLE